MTDQGRFGGTTDAVRGATVRVEDVEKEYATARGGATTALEGVSFSVDAGEFVCVVGPSGCGKTTLLRLVAGLDAPTSGTVRVDGDRVREPSPDRPLVFQEHRLFPWLSVRENVAFGLVEAGMDSVARRERTDELLSLVGLREVADAAPGELSGGMAQRVGLARALAVDPDLLLLDEPFASLDALTQRRLQGELLDAWQRTRTTVLFVTHDVEEAVRLGDRVLVLAADRTGVTTTFDVDVPRPRDEHPTALAEAETCVLDAIEAVDR
jgi:NitT/TauT family transport system ATP-binding protein